MVNAFRQRNFAILWFAGFISITGDWVLNVALPYYVFQMTGSALATGLMFMARTVPGVLFGSLAGVFVDRWNRKWTMVVVNLFSSLLVLLLFAVTSISTLWIVYLVAFIESSVVQFFVPAEKALLPRLVGEKYLVIANSLSALNVSLGMFLGPAIGGALMGLGGLGSVILFDSVSYLIAGAMISVILVPPEISPMKVHVTDALRTWADLWGDWLSGLKLVIQNKLATTIFASAAIAMLGEGIIQALLILFVNVLKGGTMEFGWLLTARGLGGLLGGLIFGQIGAAIKPHRVFPWTLAGIGLLLLIMFNIHMLSIALIALCFTGILAIGASVTSTTMLQSSISNAYLGRIFGIMGMITALMTLLGQGSASFSADRWGPVVLLNIGAVLYISAGLISFGRKKYLSNFEVIDAGTLKT